MGRLTAILGNLRRLNPANAAWRKTLDDPLLVTTSVFLILALVATIVSLVSVIVSLVSSLANGAPYGQPFTDPAWIAVAGKTLSAWALWAIAGGIGEVLALIDSVADGQPFAPANADRIESLGWRVLELAAITWIAARTGAVLGGSLAGIDLDVTPNGSPALAFALVLFVLARVFRHGTRIEADLEGTV